MPNTKRVSAAGKNQDKISCGLHSSTPSKTGGARYTNVKNNTTAINPPREKLTAANRFFEKPSHIPLRSRYILQDTAFEPSRIESENPAALTRRASHISSTIADLTDSWPPIAL